MGGCSAINCKNRSSKHGVRLHRFPNDKKRRQLWAELCGRGGDRSLDPSKSYRLCEVHFTEDQYELHRADGRKLLKWNAVPSIFNLSEPAYKRRRENISNTRSASKYKIPTIHYDVPNLRNVSVRRGMEIENVPCESPEIIDKDYFTLHRIPLKNLSFKLDHFAKKISSNLRQCVKNKDVFRIENMPHLSDFTYEKEFCELKGCEQGCTHRIIIENYHKKIVELEEELISLKEELNSIKFMS